MNFDFLKPIPEFEKLYKTCADAERFVDSEPNVSASAARRAIEYIVKLVYSSYVSPYIEGLTVYDMLTDSRMAGSVIDRELADDIHFVRKCGNRAVHENTVNAEEALQALKKLHRAVGEICVRLGLAGSYPAFERMQQTASNISEKPVSEVDLELSASFVAELHRQIILRKEPVRHSEIIDVHKAVGNRNGTDTGANSKTALREADTFLREKLPECSVWSDPRRGIITLTAKSGNVVSISVKSGCPPLSSVVNGEVQLLPDIDIVLYATDLNANTKVANQLRVFSREEFLRMWKDLGLIRKKVSSAAVRKYKEMYGPDFKTDIDKHADSISVQSFSNSGRKSALVAEACKQRKTLSEGGIKAVIELLNA